MVSGTEEEEGEQERIELSLQIAPEDAKLVQAASKKRKVRSLISQRSPAWFAATTAHAAFPLNGFPY